MTDTTSTPVADEQPATETTATAVEASTPAADAATAPAASTTTPPNPYAATQTAPAAPAATNNGLSIASLVVGIVAIPTGITLASIAAIVLGFVGRAKEPQSRTMANWGIALGFVGVFGWLIFAIVGFAFFAPFALLGFGADWGWGWDGFGNVFDALDRF